MGFDGGWLSGEEMRHMRRPELPVNLKVWRVGVRGV